MLPYLEIPAQIEERGVVIWLHGLGADGRDLEPVAQMLGIPGLRHILPDAPVRPVTINGGMQMRAWYDIAEVDFHAGRADEAGLLASADAVVELVEHCVRPGTPLLIAGFSQGGAVGLVVGLKRIPHLRGLLVLSSYLPESVRAGECHKPPIFMAHGTRDQIVFPEWGRTSRDWLDAAGFTVSWHEYPMSHAICMEEIQDMADWIRRAVPPG